MNATTQLRPLVQLIADVVEENRPCVKQLIAEMNARHTVDGLPDAAAVLARHPEVATNHAIVRDLAYEEFCQRLDAGERLDPIAFAARFPACQSSLRRVINTHQKFDRDPELLPDPEGLAELVAGNTFSGFTLRQELGRGKTARVFLAHEPALGNRPVALKISCLGPAEAETLGRLRHPNIVQVHSVQRDAASDLTIVCMAYHGRATLEDVLDHAFQGPSFPTRADVIREAIHNASKADETLAGAAGPRLPTHFRGGTYVDGILDLALPLAEALAFVHAQGIYHRDLKPSNVLVSPDGRPLLLDFNLSFDADASKQLVGGTVPYMAPEQLLATDRRRGGDTSRLDARTDLYSLGVILYELLTGRHPFGPVPWAMPPEAQYLFLVGRQRHPPYSVRQFNPHVDRLLQRLIEQCLAYNPDDRPQSAQEVALALRAAQSRLRRGRRWLAAHPGLMTATAALLLASVAGASYALSLRDPADIRALQQGQQAAGRGRLAEAVEQFNRAQDANPARADVHFARGRAHQAKKEYDAAVTDYCTALDLPADDDLKARSRACLAYCFSQLNDHPVAIWHYEQLERAGRVTAGMLNNCGWSRMHVRGAAGDQAETCFTRAIALDANLLPAYYNRAEYHLQKASRDRRYPSEPGIEDIKRAIGLAPDSPWLHYDAARHYAVALRNTRQQSYVEPALVAVQQALALGIGAARLRDDSLLMNVLGSNARLRKLLEASPPTNPHLERPAHLADPLR